MNKHISVILIRIRVAGQAWIETISVSDFEKSYGREKGELRNGNRHIEVVAGRKETKASSGSS